MHSELSYNNKLKIFHDVFIEYSWKYIERQRIIEYGQEIPAMTTPFKESLSPFRIVPVVGGAVDVAFVMSDLWNNRLSSSITVSINKLFSPSERKVKQVLSKAVHEVAIHLESKLNQLENAQTIGAFATDAVLKLISFLKTKDSESSELSHEDIVDAILKQNSYFTNDQFFVQLTGNTTTSNIRIDTDISSLRLDRHEEVIRRVEAKWDEEHTSLRQQKSAGFYNVRDAVHNFVGRREFLKQIHDCFTQGGSVIEIIGGLGGVGKTQAALQYIKEHKAEYGYRVRWIEAESKASLDASFREFAQKLKLTIEKKTDDDIRTLVIEKLEADIEQTLLVFDNVEDRTLASQYLPNLGGAKQHHILITTRNTKEYDKHASRSGEDVILLTPFTKAEAIQYIQIILPDSIDEDALELANLFDNIPLGLSQSVAYIENNAYSIRQYIDEYLIVRKQGLPEHLHDAEFESEAGHIANIYATLSMSLEALAGIPKAKEMLRICSYLHADTIPEYLFDSLFDNPKEKKDAIALLKGYSLISVKIEGDIKFIYIHRIVQEVTRADIGDESLQYLQQAMELVHDQMADCSPVLNQGLAIWNEHKVLKRNKPFLQHLISLIVYYDENEPLHKTQDNFYLRREDHRNQINFFEYCIDQDNEKHALVESPYKKGQDIWGKLYSDCGNLYYSVGDFNEALKYYTEALCIKTVVYGNRHYEIAKEIFAIGKIYQVFSRDAYDVFKTALCIVIELKEESSIAVGWRTLADLRREGNILDESLEGYISILPNIKKTFGEGHPETALTLYEIGNVYQLLGSHDNALKVYGEAYNILIATDNTDHPIIALISNNIGEVLFREGKYEEAFEKYVEAYSLLVEIYGNKHPNIARISNNIGDIFVFQGDYAAAFIKYNEAWDIMQGTYGFRHPNIIPTLNNMAHLHYVQGEYQVAINLYQFSLGIVQPYYRQYKDFSFLIHRGLGKVYQDLRRYDEVINEYNKALQAGSQNKLELLSIVDNMGNLYEFLGNYKEALSRYKNALILSKSIGRSSEHSDIFAIICSIKKMYQIAGQKQEAIEFFKQELVSGKRLYGEGHTHVKNIFKLIQDLEVEISQDTQVLFIKDVQYDNPLLNYPDILLKAKEFGGSELLKDLMEMGEDSELAYRIIDAFEQYGLEFLLTNLFSKHQEPPKIQLDPDKVQLLLETIDKTKNIIGERELSESQGFYQYVYNALSNNQFSSIAKQLIESIGVLVNTLEALLDMSEYYRALDINVDTDEQTTIIWTQLEHLLEFAGSGQWFIRSIPRAPYFDHGNEPFGGFGGDAGDDSLPNQDNNINTVFMYLPGQLNETSFLEL